MSRQVMDFELQWVVVVDPVLLWSCLTPTPVISIFITVIVVVLLCVSPSFFLSQPNQ